MTHENIVVLVTGGAGYIGSHATLALLDRGYSVVVIDNLTTGFSWAVPESVKLYKGNVSDQDLLSEIFKSENISCIMHFAGSLSVPESVQDPLKYYQNNVAETCFLLKAAVNNKIPHFVFSSTCATYGIPSSSLINEDAPTKPVSPYGWSKLMTEQILRDTAAAFCLNYAILRYFNVAGADPAGRSGHSTLSSGQLVKAAVEAASGKRKCVDIFGIDYETADGTGVRDYIHVTDLAEAHVLALEKIITAPDQNLLLNCGYGKGHSVREVLDQVEKVSGVKIAQRVAPRRVGDPPELIADNQRILDTLNWEPAYADLETIVSHAFSWEQRLGRSKPRS